MPAHSPVIGDKVKMPSGGIKILHIRRTVKTYQRTIHILVIKESLISFKHRCKRLIRLFLCQLASYIYLGKSSIDPDHVEPVDAPFLNCFIQNIKERTDISYSPDIHLHITVKKCHIGERNCLGIRHLLNSAITCSTVHFTIDDYHLTVKGVECTKTCVTMLLKFFNSYTSMIIPECKPLQKGHLEHHITLFI